MEKEITLPCGNVISINKILTKSMAETDTDFPNWLPYVNIIYDGEFDILVEKISIPIQLRSLDTLIGFLIQIKEELQK